MVYFHKQFLISYGLELKVLIIEFGIVMTQALQIRIPIVKLAIYCFHFN